MCILKVYINYLYSANCNVFTNYFYMQFYLHRWILLLGEKWNKISSYIGIHGNKYLAYLSLIKICSNFCISAFSFMCILDSLKSSFDSDVCKTNYSHIYLGDCMWNIFISNLLSVEKLHDFGMPTRLKCNKIIRRMSLFFFFIS